jgi:hypothetical protein
VTDYQQCDRAGQFKGDITEYGLRQMQAPSQAVCVPIKVLLTEWWDGAQWVDWRSYGMEAQGDIWIGKKDGAVNEKQIEALVKCAGWDGNLASLVDGSWTPTPCQVAVEEDSYNDQTRFRISWLNPLDRTPGGGSLSNVDETNVKALEARFGSPSRAIVAAAKRNAAPTTGKPPAPPKPAARQPVPAGAGDDGIPF